MWWSVLYYPELGMPRMTSRGWSRSLTYTVGVRKHVLRPGMLLIWYRSAQHATTGRGLSWGCCPWLAFVLGHCAGPLTDVRASSHGVDSRLLVCDI